MEAWTYKALLAVIDKLQWPRMLPPRQAALFLLQAAAVSAAVVGPGSLAVARTSALKLRGGDPAAEQENVAFSQNVAFYHAPLSFFALDRLTPKGPRKNADVGDPADATRALAKFGSASAGSWHCTEGGWDSPAKRGTTEVFYVLVGEGCVTDIDGTKHAFGAGDTVVLPKGWSGRWDVTKAIHKVWIVHDHPDVEDAANPIRAVVSPTKAPTELSAQANAIHGLPESAIHQIYDVGPTTAGFWASSPGSFRFDRSTTEWLHVLEGTFFLTNADGSAQRCTAGDTVLLPKGWCGLADVIETVKAVSATASE